MSDWDDYRFVLAVHRAGTVRGAAKSLGVNHATVSRRLGQLSGDPPLFERVRGGYQVTETGALWVRAAEEMEGLVMASERRTRAQHVELSGPLRLSLPTTLSQTVLLKPIAEFIRLHPRIELSVRTSMTFADLDRSEADVVVRGAEQPGDHLVGRRLFRYGLCCYSAPDYLRQTPPEERRWLRYGLSLDPGWIARSPYPDAPIAWVSDDLMVLQRSAAAGYGMLRTACYLGDADPGLVRLPGARVEAAQPLWILTHPDLRASPRVNQLMDWLGRALRDERELLTGESSLS